MTEVIRGSERFPSVSCWEFAIVWDFEERGRRDRYKTEYFMEVKYAARTERFSRMRGCNRKSEDAAVRGEGEGAIASAS